MNKLRIFLIKLLVGKMEIAMNIEVDGMISGLKGQKYNFVSNCIVKGRKKEMKTGRKIFFEIRKLENKLGEIREKKMVAEIGSPGYVELKKERDQLYVELDKLLNAEYVDTDSLVITQTGVEIDKEVFKRYMNEQHGQLSEEDLKYKGGITFINPKFAE